MHVANQLSPPRKKIEKKKEEHEERNRSIEHLPKMAKLSFVPSSFPLCFFSLFILLTLPTNSVGLSSSENACNTSAAFDTSIDYTFCVDALSRDPRSQAADFAGLLEVATESARNQSWSAFWAAHGMGKSASTEGKAPLLVCKTQFAKALLTIKVFDMARRERLYYVAEDLQWLLRGMVKCEGALKQSPNYVLPGTPTSRLQQLVLIIKALAHFASVNKQ